MTEDLSHKDATPVYPVPLNSMEQIKKQFACGENEIKKWVAQGAPILVYGAGTKTRYRAEYNRLFDWLLQHGKGE